MPAHKKDGADQAIGRSKGGLSTEHHALVDALRQSAGLHDPDARARQSSDDLDKHRISLPCFTAWAAELGVIAWRRRPSIADVRVIVSRCGHAASRSCIPPKSNRKVQRDLQRRLQGSLISSRASSVRSDGKPSTAFDNNPLSEISRRKLRCDGEELVFQFERERLRQLDRSDLVSKIRWISEEDGDGAGYDILSFDAKGKERFIEVKTTVGSEITPFYITRNELSLSSERPDAFRLCRVFEFTSQPRMFELVPPLEKLVHLSPLSYEATFS